MDGISLTYDRPDTCNKVILQRSSTGMWKVCSSGQSNKSAEITIRKFPVQSIPTIEFQESEQVETSKHMLHDKSYQCVEPRSTFGSKEKRVTSDFPNSSAKHRTRYHNQCSMCNKSSVCNWDVTASDLSINGNNLCLDSTKANMKISSGSIIASCTCSNKLTYTDCINHKYHTRLKSTVQKS